MPIWSLERLFDNPAKIEAAERERQAARRREQNDDDGAPPSFRCRVCGFQGPDRSYCPHCLADTMERAPARPPGAEPADE